MVGVGLAQRVDQFTGTRSVAADLVAAVGAGQPPGLVLLPLGAGHPGVEQGPGHQVEAVGPSSRDSPGPSRRTRGGGSGCSRAPRPSGCSGMTRRRTSRPGAGSSTRCPRCRPPHRRCRSARSRLCGAVLRQRPRRCPRPRRARRCRLQPVATYDRCERVVSVAGEELVGPQVSDVGAAWDSTLLVGHDTGQQTPHLLHVHERRRPWLPNRRFSI
jgi:hypothetical protein